MTLIEAGALLVPKAGPDVEVGSAQARIDAAKAAFKLVRILDVVSSTGDVVYRHEGPGLYNYGQTRAGRLSDLLERNEVPDDG